MPDKVRKGIDSVSAIEMGSARIRVIRTGTVRHHVISVVVELRNLG